jgi:hypothetical protein
MRKLESYVKKYGPKEGPKMYRRLQREAALASGHARHKKSQAVKSAAAVELGKRGGEARAKTLTKEQLSKIGKVGAAKRWGTKADEKGEK